MTPPVDLAGIIERDRQSVTWADFDAEVPQRVSDAVWQAAADRRALLGELERVRAEYQRFYDFVGDSHPALTDAWRFTENARAAKP